MPLNFDHASLAISNLGGHGGPIDSDINGPQVVRIGGVGTLADGTVIDLQISNVTSYDTFNSIHNGVKHRTNGSFGSVNLRAAQSSSVPASFVQLQFAFVAATDSSPLTLGRTYVTFYDFDNSKNGIRECMQARGGVIGETVTLDTELQRFEINQTEIAASGVSGLDPTLQ